MAAGMVFVSAAAAGTSQDSPRVETSKVKNYRGRTVTVCGKVVTHGCADRPDRATILDLDKPYWSKPVAILIPESARGSFPARLEDRYVLGSVCATGVVERRDGRHMVRVDDPARITIEQEPSAPSPFATDAFRPCDRGIQMPAVVREVKPEYTYDALRGLQQGLVFAEVLVLPDGTVGTARIVHGLRPRLGLDEEAVKALRRWRFTPGTLEGRAVPVVVTIELSFRLK